MYVPITKSLSSLGVIMLAGYLSRRIKIFSAHDTKVLAAFIYNFSLPALFFVEIARIDFSMVESGLLIGTLLPLALIGMALVILRVFGVLTKDNFTLFSLSIIFSSHAFFGIPFFESLYGQWGLDISILTGTLLSIIGIFCSLSLFEYATQRCTGFLFLLKIFKSPLIASILVGGIFSILKPPGTMYTDILLPLGKTASGTAIFLLGMFLYDHFSVDLIKKALPLALFRIIALPLVTLAVVFLFCDQRVLLKRYLLLQSAIPSAISIAIFAERYQYKISELTGMVVLTSLTSFLTLGIFYFLSYMLF